MMRLVSAGVAVCLGISLSSGANAENQTSNGLNEKFERWEGGSPEAEAQMVEVLKAAFKQIQAGAATDGKLHRGTHAKGTCALGTMEVYDIEDESLRVGLFATPSLSPVRVRFANGSGKIQPDTVPDARSLSVAVFSKYGRQDFSMNNDPVFPVPTLSDFVLQVTFPATQAKISAQVAAEGYEGEAAQNEVKRRLAAHYAPTNGLARLQRIGALGKRLTDKDVWSYATQEYWTGTAISYGPDRAAKFKFSPCDGEVVQGTPADASNDYLQEGFKDAVEDTCFHVYVQFLDETVMQTPEGKRLEAWQWVEDAGLDWDAAGAPFYEHPLAKLTILKGTDLDPEDCDHVGNAFNITDNALPVHKALGGINRGRTRVEKSSQDNRG